MFNFMVTLVRTLFSMLFSKRKDLVFSVLLLKKENEILKRHLDLQNRKPIFSRKDRLAFAFIKSLSEQATRLLTLVKPETLLRWQKQFIKNHWTYESKKRGRPHIKRSEKELILEMKQENHLWGCRRIADELQKLDISVHYSTVNRILQTYRKNGKLQPNGSWRKFLKAHWQSLYAADFMNIDTVFGKRLHLLLIVQLKTRRIVTWRLTEHPTREFVRQQIIEFTYGLPEAVTLIYDNGPQFTSIDYSQYNIKAVDTSVEAPNMNVYVERLIGSVRREALDHFLLFSEKQVRGIVSEYVDYYNTMRPHQGLHRIPQRSERSGSSMLVPFPSECRESKVKYPPLGAECEALPPLSRVCPGGSIPFIPECGNIPETGKIQKKSVLWGLHHHYYKDSA